MLEAHVLSIVILGVSSFIVGSIPLKLARWSHQPFILSLLLCFGGGVLLGTSLIHMLGEIRPKLAEYSELIFCAGFLFLYAVDELIHLCVQDVHRAEKYERISPRRSRISSTSSSEDGLVQRLSHHHNQRLSYGTIEKSSLSPGAADYQICPNKDDETTKKRDSISFDLTASDICCRKHKKEKSYQREAWKCEASASGDGDKNIFPAKFNSESSASFSDEHVEHCHVEAEKPCSQSTSSLLGLLVALVVHAMLEGCSIGVQTDSKQILLVLAAISCHKLVLAFCLGLELAAAGFDGLQYLIAITAFSIGCPIGVVIGISITHSSDGIFFLEAPLQALAGGSLLYVAVFEVLPRERYKWQHNDERKFATFFQMVFVILGLTFVVILGIFADYHGHNSRVKP